MSQTMTRSFLVFGALVAGLALSAVGCGSGRFEAGTPSALAAINGFTGGGGGGGGGAGQFLAVAYDDSLLFGPPAPQSTTPAEMHIFAEPFQGAQDFELQERIPPGSGTFAATALPNPQQNGPFAFTNGTSWFIDLPQQDGEYRIEAFDAGGQSLGFSNVIRMKAVNSYGSFAMTQPQNGFWLDTTTFSALVALPQVPVPTQITWNAATGARSYVIWCFEIDPTITQGAQGPQPTLNETLNFIALQPQGTSFDVQNGFYFEPPQAAAFQSGKKYLIMIVGCDSTDWGNSTTIDLFNPTAPGPWNGAFEVQ